MCCRIILSKYQATPLARRQRQASGLKPSLAHAGPHPLIPLIYQAHRVRRSVRYAAVFPPPGCPAPGRRVQAAQRASIGDGFRQHGLAPVRKGPAPVRVLGQA